MLKQKIVSIMVFVLAVLFLTGSALPLHGGSHTFVITGYFIGQDGVQHGFIFDWGTKTWHLLDAPGSASTQPYGVNDSRVVVGYTIPNQQAFEVDKSDYNENNFVFYSWPGATTSNIMDINNNGVKCGWMNIPGGYGDGFYMDGAGIHWVQYPDTYLPGPVEGTVCCGINDFNDIAGYYITGYGPDACTGFVYSNGLYRSISFYGMETFCYDINNRGEIAGSYFDRFSGTTGGFACLLGGGMVEIQFPGSYYTKCYGINDAGLIVGVYRDENHKMRGFITNGRSRYRGIRYPGSIETVVTGISNNIL